jgi:hypothetical protein
VDSDYAQDSSSEPEAHGQERESLSSLPLTAVVATAEGHTAPSPGIATVVVVEPGNQDTKDSSPASGEDYKSSY